MTKLKPLIYACALTALSCGMTYADDIYLDVGTSFNATDADSLTDDFEKLLFSVIATSTYTIDDNIFGGDDTALDTGDKVVDTGHSNIGSLETSAAAALVGPALEGFNNDWGLTIDYTISGYTVVGPGGIPDELAAVFTDGTANIFFDDFMGTETKVLELALTSSMIEPTNVLLTGIVDYSWCDPACGSFVEDFFNFSDLIAGEHAFYDIWALDLTPPISIMWRLDTNIDEAAVVSPEPIFEGSTTWTRETELSPTIQFVPEPGTYGTMLLGLGLLFFSQRRRMTYALTGEH
ncbi:PEP-CTERM sorting domain-containing protein [Zooshikella harenae]|uniref:PEP-CTERM sorting domain-containing protein n=1 Tax=Zooshikella harenae TaxID=2827238 RepID=A0ABS5ZCG1_9GAMM|nr:PEP-CTERM sorting domain-containing protein [Zooshikella harenae]MBU2711757.1 PEP-CTERM sorting domain-containing protein [Zooshikella harenae]